MELGGIYHYKDYEFNDGIKKDKFCVVVNSPTPTSNENYLFCLTTSKEKPPYREKKQGCQAEKNYFMLFSTDDWFKKDTWIVFNELQEISKQKILTLSIAQKKLQQVGKLKQNNIKELLDCILKSDDVSSEHLSFIKNTLKGSLKD